MASRLPARSFGRLRSLSIRRRWATTYAIAEFGHTKSLDGPFSKKSLEYLMSGMQRIYQIDQILGAHQYR